MPPPPPPSSCPPTTAAPTTAAASGPVVNVTSPPLAGCPGGIATGRIMDNGVGVQYAYLTVYSASNPNVSVRSGSTDADGRFRIVNIPLGTYKLRIMLPGYQVVQWWPGKADHASAGTFTFTAIGEEKVLDDQALPHGGITGHITTATGGPSTDTQVVLYSTDGARLTSVAVDADGGYTFGFLAPGTYKLSVERWPGFNPTQYVHGRTSLADADPITVALGAPTVVDEQLLATGEITGVVTDQGQPVANVLVEARLVNGTGVMAVYTDADGRYRLNLLPGQYKLRLQVYWDQLEQWWPDSDDEAGAQTITVTAGGSVVADAQARPSVTVWGNLFQDNSEAAYGATVELTEVTTGRTYRTTAYGQWQLPVRPGTYTARFEWNGQVQWYHRATTAGDARQFVVGTGDPVFLEETFLGAASILVSATDARTGAKVDSFCAILNGTSNGQRCTNTGVAEFEVGAGVYSVTVDDGVHVIGTIDNIRVAAGDRVTRSVALTAGGSIEFTAVDAGTGAPIANACLASKLVDRAPEPGPSYGGFACTDDEGRYTFERITPDRYQFFAPVYDDVHGAQWVGPRGGVGSQDEAKVFTVREGVVTKVTVRFDKRGSISGKVTDRATGQPIFGAYANIAGMQAGGIVGSTDTDGAYTLDGLGPYAWKLSFWHPDYAGQWSGAVAERSAATTVKVRVGATTTYNLPMRKGTLVTGVVTSAPGTQQNWLLVTVLNARTHDFRSYIEVNADGTYRGWVLGPQKVHLSLEGSVDGVRGHVWWRDGKTFAGADTLAVPRTGTVTANFTFNP
ncbi:hypothetical protein GCM10009682_31630 [Luedemannella flava]|uniref:Alpha-amylase n=2 Tax=Luedemannella flava TaxID=349316 RepID=A0ABN2M2S4_9ACTN